MLKHASRLVSRSVARPTTPSSIPTKLTVNFVRPYSTQLPEKEAPPMARAMWKGPFVDAFLLKLKNKGEPLANRKIWSRRSVILPEFLNSTVRIYNGKTFVRCKITEGKVGHKFGEFALTRRRKKMRGSDAKGANKKVAGKKK